MSYGVEALAIDLDHIQHINPSRAINHPGLGGRLRISSSARLL
jgi:hypothetical protein